ncbi:MAG: AAA family ATPase, partial [Candidatus Gastranaerophilales bacterium]|nr:AAA family ATPase [Candidatus Gastranaerophilales bacterium]
MIKTLYIKNFILIDELLLNFTDGFNVLLGETGAGKSIIIKAIDTALGAKTSKDVLKNPLNHALLELTFNDCGKELIISREISQTGTKCRINGALVTLDEIKSERERLIDIHTQFQTYTYIKQKYHITLLDLYIQSEKNTYGSLLLRQENNFKRYVEVKKTLDKIKSQTDFNRDKTEFLKFQIDEIEKAAITENEEEELNNELEILSNVQELKELSYGSYYALNGDETPVLEALGRIGNNISRIK